MAGSPASDVVGLPAVDPDEIRDVIDRLPDYRSYPLKPKNGTMQLCVMPEAWKGAGRTEDDPGSVREYYFEEQDLLVVDLSRP